MASPVVSREVSPFLIKLRTLFLGREARNALRFQKDMAPRPGPAANLVEGPSHKLAFNYYFTRDGRREVGLPKELASNVKAAKALSTGEGNDKATEMAVPLKAPTPGKLYNYGS
jgi:NADH dehydrogenase (ubiquinone) 1 alpha subcomplex subunit 7